MLKSEENKPFRRPAVTTVLTLVLLCLMYLAGVATGLCLAGGYSQYPLVYIGHVLRGNRVRADVDFAVLWEVWGIVERKFYYDLPDDDELTYGAIRGMLRTLGDPYTAFVPPDVAQILREDNSGFFEGIGAYVEAAPQGGIVIIRPFEGGPSEQAGIRAGDVIVAVDAQDITQMPLNEALLLVRGPAGTEVTLTIWRENEPKLLDFTVKRARIEVPTIEAHMEDDSIGYIALFEFNAQSSVRLRVAVEELIEQGATAIILDLRNNPGGLLDQAIDIADLFLPKGLIATQRDVDGNEREHSGKDGDLAEQIPLVVLVNGNSASASEIVAGAIQDRGRGILIGETTFGKGSVQLQYDLSDGSQLRVTYANWFTPNGTSISQHGVTPDITVPTPEQPTGNDPQLERALEYLNTGR